MSKDAEAFPDIEKYTLEQLDELIIEAKRILDARVKHLKNSSRWLLLQFWNVAGAV